MTDLYWSVDSKLLVQSSEDKEIRLWDPMSLKLIFSFPKKQYIQSSCFLSADGNYAISSSNGFQGNGCEITVSLGKKKNFFKNYFKLIKNIFLMILRIFLFFFKRVPPFDFLFCCYFHLF